MSTREYIRNKNLIQRINDTVSVNLEKWDFVIKQFRLGKLLSTHTGKYDMKTEMILSVQMS